MVSKISLLLSLGNSPVKVVDHFDYFGSSVYPGLGSRYEDKQSLSHRSWLVQNDVVVKDLNKCNLLGGWRDVVIERAAKRGVVKLSGDTVNKQLLISETDRKDQRKKRREREQPASYQCACDEHGSHCASSKASITNYKRQKHGVTAQSLKLCS